MNKYLGHWITEIVDIFYFLGGDVFSLCQLENVLFSVSDLQGAILQQGEKSLEIKIQILCH